MSHNLLHLVRQHGRLFLLLALYLGPAMSLMSHNASPRSDGLLGLQKRHESNTPDLLKRASISSQGSDSPRSSDSSINHDTPRSAGSIRSEDFDLTPMAQVPPQERAAHLQGVRDKIAHFRNQRAEFDGFDAQARHDLNEHGKSLLNAAPRRARDPSIADPMSRGRELYLDDMQTRAVLRQIGGAHGVMARVQEAMLERRYRAWGMRPPQRLGRSNSTPVRNPDGGFAARKAKHRFDNFARERDVDVRIGRAEGYSRHGDGEDGNYRMRWEGLSLLDQGPDNMKKEVKEEKKRMETAPAELKRSKSVGANTEIKQHEWH